MKVLLINPAHRGYYFRLGAVYPPLGLMYISSVLKRANHCVTLIDMNVQPFDWQKFDYSDFDVVGISTDTPRFPLAKQIALRAKNRGTITVLGGPHASAEYESILKEGICDYVVLGEGEHTFLQLLESLEHGEPHPQIDGLAYLSEGEIFARPPKFAQSLDELPFPDRENVKLYKTKFSGRPATSMVTSRGCPFDCEFCSASQFMGRRIRERSVENVLEELELIKKMGYGSVIFFDDNFTLNTKRTIKLCEGMLKRNLNFRWWAFARADELLNRKDLLEAMSKSGCKMLFIGFESAEDNVLKEYKKGLSSSIALEVVKLLKKYRIDVFASFVLGALNDTKETIMKTIRFAKKLKASIVQFSILTPYPGTRLYENLKNKLLSRDFSLFDGTHLVFEHPRFSPSELNKIFIKAYYYVYSSPRMIFKRGIPFLLKLLKNREKDRSFDLSFGET
ncbi:MAG: Radical SAM domain protein [Thermotoga sp. 50_1627]|uniref:B12-binding domain-containing radical SAM protein n=1 Tax=Pseudothermotoga sp. TaxID=2033661 RepID=UPI00076DDD8C|nr:MAG: Radical SAM domain protein [Thermotoga sp. 50_64]KUK24942.1 MAG: Radical SAM domain protein [Thermotoga sp. 50_1627]MBC7116667.1 B12-binding domain-containing radical SAM protein [Pseudothermotoga sp.]MDK2922749.1 anaerobic magnesium-protoporphyrin monomethyl ester cyclase [Pseudothermotoga sp.]HBT39296.1 B12-binding domain-containing radical SAM protein [Pseudothermotoga sp.]